MKPSEYGLYVRDLTHLYGKRTVLDRVELSVAPGEIFGFLGQNGAGKSTAIRAFCGFLQPTSGEIWVAGVDVRKDPVAAKRQLGVVSDDVALYDRLTGLEFLVFVGQMQGLSGLEAHNRACDLMERLELADAANRLIGGYSLGMRKKTAFASALIHAPRVLFLDEPFNGVDAASTRTLCGLLKSLAITKGITVFLTSHVLEMTERLCNRVAILHEGKIQQEGTVAELKAAAEQQHATLEDLFLHLTGATSATDTTLPWYH